MDEVVAVTGIFDGVDTTWKFINNEQKVLLSPSSLIAINFGEKSRYDFLICMQIIFIV